VPSVITGRRGEPGCLQCRPQDIVETVARGAVTREHGAFVYAEHQPPARTQDAAAPLASDAASGCHNCALLVAHVASNL